MPKLIAEEVLSLRGLNPFVQVHSQGGPPRGEEKPRIINGKS